MRSNPKLAGRLLIGCCLLTVVACAQRASNAVSPAAVGAPRVLIVGGGSSHDFTRWYQQVDSATLASASARVRYTETPSEILPRLSETDVLYLVNNQPLSDSGLRDAIFAHVRAGKGLIIGHAASWYNWRDWPVYNRDLVGGGTRAHRRYGAFRVDVVAPNHPIMQGVPTSFTLSDELYRFIPDAEGPAITVLATAREEETGTVYPIIWTVQNPNGRIVVNTLGHDGEAHEHEAYQTILRNSLRWVSRQGA